jgi:flavin-dependent thymidylate synthase
MGSGGPNRVELMGWYGSDETHALSAWTSTSRELTDDKRTRIPQLLRMLAEQGHHSVFEKSSLHFLVTMDIATHIQLLKHRVAVSVNAESARYKELRDDKFYVPIDWPNEEQERYVSFVEDCFEQYHDCIKRLVQSGVPRARAKESARYYLPYGNQITCDVMFNWRSFHHFLGLRMKPEAQREICWLAEEMLELIKNIESKPFERTIEAFGY